MLLKDFLWSEGEVLNYYSRNIEKQITDLLKQLVISDTDYKKLKPRGLRFGTLYGLCKIHKSFDWQFSWINMAQWLPRRF